MIINGANVYLYFYKTNFLKTFFHFDWKYSCIYVSYYNLILSFHLSETLILFSWIIYLNISLLIFLKFMFVVLCFKKIWLKNEVMNGELTILLINIFTVNCMLLEFVLLLLINIMVII